MKEIIVQTRAVIEEKPASDSVKKRFSRWMLALYLSLCAGIISAVSGLFLGAVSYLGLFRNAKAVNQIGNLMIIAAFPLMMFGAHALDKINEIRTNKK